MRIRPVSIVFSLLFAISIKPIYVEAQSGFSITPKECDPLFFHSQSHTFSSTSVHAGGSWIAHVATTKQEDPDKEFLQKKIDEVGENSAFFDKLSELCRQELNRQASQSSATKNNSRIGTQLSDKISESADNEY